MSGQPARVTASSRRAWLRTGLGLAAFPLLGRAAAGVTTPMLDREQSGRFRDWMTLLIHEQLERGPTPRWTHRDCAGLVRFCVGETLRPHDLAWRRANGLLGRRLPADLDSAEAMPLRNVWRRADGSQAAYVGALELVQENTRLVSRQLGEAALGDLLFFDQGDDQHLMVWMGNYIAYHTGRVATGDNGLRAVRAAQLLGWTDTRWRPTEANLNFAGVYRLAFLTR